MLFKIHLWLEVVLESWPQLKKSPFSTFLKSRITQSDQDSHKKRFHFEKYKDIDDAWLIANSVSELLYLHILSVVRCPWTMVTSHLISTL